MTSGIWVKAAGVIHDLDVHHLEITEAYSKRTATSLHPIKQELWVQSIELLLPGLT